MNAWPIRRRFSCGSVTPASAFRNVASASTTRSSASVRRPNASTTAARSLRRKSPVSTNTQTTRGPSARASSAAQTAESTPPDSPQTTRSAGPTRRGDLGHRPLDEGAHRPGPRVAADPVEEVAQDQRAIGRVRDLGVELQPVERQARDAGPRRSGNGASRPAGRSRRPRHGSGRRGSSRRSSRAGRRGRSGRGDRVTRQSVRPYSPRAGLAWTRPPRASTASCKP